MSIVTNIRKGIKKLVFGDTLLPQEFTLGLTDPQTEIGVWLHGSGDPRDVTHYHSIACCAPFVICIGFEREQAPGEKELTRLSLRFCEREGRRRVLGKIGLKPATNVPVISTEGSEIFFFQARSSSNYCLPRMRLGAHYLFQAKAQLGASNTSGIEMSFLERRATMIMFIRPHPISLVSAIDNQGGNIFTMNIMGNLGHGQFGFALKDSRTAAHIVERVGRIALSTVPLPQARLVFELAANHFKESIDWNELPFETKSSRMFRFPVPVFASRVREMEVEKINKIGSHTFFVAKIISEQTFAQVPIVCAIHGFYQSWRLKGQRDELRAALTQHWINKPGMKNPG